MMAHEIVTREEEPAQVVQGGEITTIDPMALISLAVQKDAPIEKLERLLDLRDRLEADAARRAYDEAMAAFKSDCPRITKNNTVDYSLDRGGRVSYKHATLDHICQTINPVLGKFGLSYSWDTRQDANGIVKVTCVVAHCRGYRSEGTPLMAPPDVSGRKNGIQAIGSVVTYLQRYTLLAALGLSTENDDDDGRGSGEEIITEPAQERAQERPGYSPEDFAANLPKWRKLVEEGKKDPEAIIRTVSTKGVLSEKQKGDIRALAQPQTNAGGTT